MRPHKEIEFENNICAHVAGNGWLHAEEDDAAYDQAHAVFPEAKAHLFVC